MILRISTALASIRLFKRRLLLFATTAAIDDYTGTKNSRSPKVEFMTRVSESHASPVSFKKRLPELALKFCNLLRDGRVSHMKRGRRDVDRSARCDRV
jgi:hypothetical protein